MKLPHLYCSGTRGSIMDRTDRAAALEYRIHLEQLRSKYEKEGRAGVVAEFTRRIEKLEKALRDGGEYEVPFHYQD